MEQRRLQRLGVHHLMMLRIFSRHLVFGSEPRLKLPTAVCTRGMMDIHILMAERRRIADEFRSKLTQLSKLRNELVDARTDEGRSYLYAAVDEHSTVFRELGEKLLQLDNSVRALQAHEVAAAGLDAGSTSKG
jgi:hypothetical protein